MRDATHRRGFTLLEVMISTIILSIGLVVLLTSFANCQRIMTASRDNETAQYVLSLGETVYPIPTPDLVTGDPKDDEHLNINETTAEELMDYLEIPSSSLSRDRREELSHYTFMRMVDDVDDEELERSGNLYTLRTVVSWGSKRQRDEDRPKLEVLTLWRKAQQ